MATGLTAEQLRASSPEELVSKLAEATADAPAQPDAARTPGEEG